MAENTRQSQQGRLKKWLRVLHVYLSLYALLAILFFGVTGFIMNHPDWFSLDHVSVRTVDVQLPASLCADKDRLAIVEYLRSECGLRGAVQECDVSGAEYRITFRRAGERADVLIDATTGTAQIEIESQSLTAVMAAIHTGEHTGNFGKRVIDLIAVFLVLTSITGIVLWSTIAIRRQTGVIWLTAGVILAAVIAVRILL